MTVFDSMAALGHEQIVFCHDDATGLRAIIAVHSTVAGRSLGGCRAFAYPDEASALDDALRLSHGMTLKAAAAGVALGGGKSVIWLAADRPKTPELMRAFGRAVDALGGRYVASEDVGINEDDLAEARHVTAHVTEPIRDAHGRDANHLTALGTFVALKACVAEAFGSEDLAGRRVAIQGLGQVGGPLARLLHEAGASLIVSDLRDEAVRRAVGELGARAVDPGEILAVECDVVAPCAMGGVLDRRSIERLRCAVVCGSANNQLAEARLGDDLRRRGIVYGPDFVVNGGGLIAEAARIEGRTFAEAEQRVLGIAETVGAVFALARAEDVGHAEAAVLLATRRARDRDAGAVAIHGLVGGER